MRFEKLKDSNLLKPGELLVVPKCFKLYGDSALLHLPEIAKIGLLQFYQNRRERFRGLPGRSMAEYSGARERRTSAELTSATTRRKKSSNPMASPSSSGKNENGICCPTSIMISPSGIKEAGKSIVETSKRTRAASTVESTALRFGFREARRGLSRAAAQHVFIGPAPGARLARGAPDASPVPLYLPALQNAPGAVQTRACCKPESFGKRPPCRCQSGSALLTLISLCSWNEAPCANLTWNSIIPSSSSGAPISNPGEPAEPFSSHNR
jgi:hypothetical protein